VRRSTTIAAVEPGDRGYLNTFVRAGTRETIETDLVVHGAGRVAGLADVRLDVAGAIKLGLITRQLKSATAAYPTVGSDLGSML